LQKIFSCYETQQLILGTGTAIWWVTEPHLLEGISAASFCHQVAALVQDMFCNFYLVKNPKNVNNSATTEAREKISTYLESLEFQKIFDIGLTRFENPQFLLNKMNHRFLVTTKLYSG